MKSTDEEKSKNCIYVSAGHKINIDSAMEIVNNTCLYREPEPIRLADQIGREEMRYIEDPKLREKILKKLQQKEKQKQNQLTKQNK